MTYRQLLTLAGALVLTALPRAGLAQVDGSPLPSSGEVTEGQTTFVLPDTTALAPEQRALLRIERARSAAIARHDTTFLAGLYAEDFRGVTATGYLVDRARLMRVFALDHPDARFRMRDLDFRVFGETAVGTEVLEAMESGVPREAQRLLHVYVRRGGRWQLVAAQGTVLQDPP